MTYLTKFMLRPAFFLFLTLLLTVCTGTLYAQQQDADNSLLPEIDPQDIEIRSQFKARFPGLRRQPILGFDPSPRVYQIDRNRLPFMETLEQIVANLPISELSRPAPPAYNPLNYSSDIQLFSQIGLGSFSSPIAQFWGVRRLEKGYVGADFDYSSSGGHLDNQSSSFRFFNANADYVTKLSTKTELHLTAGGQSDFNYGVGIPTQPTTPKKLYSGFNLSADIQSFKNTVQGWTASAGIRNFTTDLELDSGTQNQDELVYEGSVTKQWAGGNINETFAIRAEAKGGNYSSTPDQETWSTLGGGAEYSRLFNYTTEVTARAEVFFTSNISEDKIYFAPYVNVVHSFNDRLKLSGTVEAKPFLKTVEQHQQTNRFLSVDNQFIHSYSINASATASLKYYRGSTLEGGISYMNTNNYAFYSRELINPGPQRGAYQVNFQDATNFKIYGGITHQLVPEKFWLSAQLYVQNPELSSGEPVPFEENWGLNSGVSVRFFNRLHIEGWADYVGSRDQLTSSESLDGFLLVGGKGDLEVTNNVGVYVEIVNLLGQEYEIWDGYTERPFQVYGGITVKF